MWFRDAAILVLILTLVWLLDRSAALVLQALHKNGPTVPRAGEERGWALTEKAKQGIHGMAAIRTSGVAFSQC